MLLEEDPSEGAGKPAGERVEEGGMSERVHSIPEEPTKSTMREE